MIHGIYQLTPRQFRKGNPRLGVSGEKRVELLGGIPFIMSQNPPHMFTSPETTLAALQVLATSPAGGLLTRRSRSR